MVISLLDHHKCSLLNTEVKANSYVCNWNTNSCLVHPPYCFHTKYMYLKSRIYSIWNDICMIHIIYSDHTDTYHIEGFV